MAGVAEGLKILRIVAASALEREDMVHFLGDDDARLADACAAQRLSSQDGLADRHPRAATQPRTV